MRYDNRKDWVEIQGVAGKSMRELTALENESLAVAHGFAVAVTVDAHFTDQAGNVVDWRNDVLGLSLQQWAWWKSRIWAAAKDEKLDPE